MIYIIFAGSEVCTTISLLNAFSTLFSHLEILNFVFDFCPSLLVNQSESVWFGVTLSSLTVTYPGSATNSGFLPILLYCFLLGLYQVIFTMAGHIIKGPLLNLTGYDRPVQLGAQTQHPRGTPKPHH